MRARRRGAPRPPGRVARARAPAPSKARRTGPCALSAKTSAYCTASRSARDRRSRSSMGTENVADAADGLDTLVVRIDLCAEARHRQHRRRWSAGRSCSPIRVRGSSSCSPDGRHGGAGTRAARTRAAAARRVCPAQVTSRVTRSSVTSPAVSFVASGEDVARRISACTRASNSENANGFVR